MALSQPNLSLLRRHLLASICGGLTVLAVGFYAFRFSELAEQKELLAQKQSESDSIQRNLRNSTELPEQLPVLQQGLVRLEDKLMKSGDVAAYQSFFFKLEADSGVKIARLQPVGGLKVGKTKQTGAYRPMAFEATVDGTFGNICAFMQNLESGPRHYRLVSFAVRRGGSANSPQANLVSLVVELELLGSP